jgi:predicted CXXCH cytochrome family protein
VYIALKETVNKLKKTIPLIPCIIFLASAAHVSHADIKVPSNPDSAKECAICHYRWVDTFFLHNKGSELVEFQSEKVVAKQEICFTCHDGSVVDSRARVYNDHRHQVDKPPPSHMKIPEIFPLDENGNMQCSTCHTAHGVSSEMGIEKTIFIRISNENSSMCRMCHADKDGGLPEGNHPIGVPEKLEIPSRLVELGAVMGDKKNQVICETCHNVHGSPYESFLIQSARNSKLCLECHADKNIFTEAGKRNPFHVINVKPERVKIPEELIEKKGAKLGHNGEIICQTCHKVHNNNIEKNLLLIMKDEKSTLCLTCHTDKQYLTDTKHNLLHSAPDEKNLEGKTVAETGICSACHLPHKAARKLYGKEDFTTRLCLSCHSKGNIAEKTIPGDYTHPLNVSPYEPKGDIILTTIHAEKQELGLPLFNKSGVPDQDGFITCTTCHDAHRWRADSTEGEIREDVNGDRTTSFLRKPSPELCEACHDDKFYIANSEHDLRKVAPEEKNILDQTPEESGLCETCHLVHGGQKDYLWARKITTRSDNTAQNLCISCHNERGIAEKKIVKDYSHPINITPAQKGLDTTLPLFKKDGTESEHGMMTCQTCHDPHRWDPVNILSKDHSDLEGSSRNSFLRLENSPSPKLCANCHTDKAYIEKTDHDLLVTAPSTQNIIGQTPEESGTCGVCHITHSSKNYLKLWAQGFSIGKNIMDMMCNSCHSKNGSAKNKIPRITSHPEDQLITNVGRDNKGELNYFPLYDKGSGKEVTVGDISCPSCHNVHKWHPRLQAKGKGKNIEGTATSSFLRQQTFSLLCIDCHGLDALFRFKYYHDPQERVERRQRPLIFRRGIGGAGTKKPITQ